MSLLIDECVTLLFRDDQKLRRGGLRVVDVLGKGTKDPVIELYAQRRDMRIVTLDRGLVYEQIKKKRVVHFVNKKNGEILEVSVRAIGKLEPIGDPITHYFKQVSQHEVIRP